MGAIVRFYMVNRAKDWYGRRTEGFFCWQYILFPLPLDQFLLLSCFLTFALWHLTSDDYDYMYIDTPVRVIYVLSISM